MKNRVDNRRRRAPLERAASGQHLVENDAERENVGPGIERIAERLLRRHVEDGSDRGAEARQRSRLRGAGLGSALVGRFDHRRQAEVEQLRVAAGSDENVGRLEIAVDDAGSVCGFERFRNLHAEADDGAERHRAGGHHLEQGQAAQQLHHEVGTILRLGRLADVEDGANVGVVQRRGGARFALEPAQVLVRRGEGGGEQFYRDVATELQIVRLVDLAHAAGAQWRDDLEAADNSGASGQ